LGQAATRKNVPTGIDSFVFAGVTAWSTTGPDIALYATRPLGTIVNRKTPEHVLLFWQAFLATASVPELPAIAPTLFETIIAFALVSAVPAS
jgi:hypothetical protein